LIAPQDYEHIYKGQPKMTKTSKSAKRIPNNVPTALIAPSDNEHIYKGNINVKKSQTPPQRSAEVLPPSVLKSVENFIQKTINTIRSIVKKCSIIWKLVFQINS
jgi:hypothetical protein